MKKMRRMGMLIANGNLNGLMFDWWIGLPYYFALLSWSVLKKEGHELYGL